MQFKCDLNVLILGYSWAVVSCPWLLGTDDRAALGSCDKSGHMSYVLSSANMNLARLEPEQQCSASRGPC